MTAVVLVGMSLTDAGERDLLQRRAEAEGATLAFLQHGQPSLVRELDRLAASGVEHVTLRAVTLGARSPGRSWLRRVAAHWVRAGADRPVVVIDDRQVTGREAPLSSSGWEDVPGHRHQVLVCRGPRCSAQGADEVAGALDAAMGAAGLGDDDVLVTQTGCLFPCNNAPVVVVHPDDVWYGRLDQEAVAQVVDRHLMGGAVVETHRLPRTNSALTRYSPFWCRARSMRALIRLLSNSFDVTAARRSAFFTRAWSPMSTDGNASTGSPSDRTT